MTVHTVHVPGTAGWYGCNTYVADGLFVTYWDPTRINERMDRLILLQCFLRCKKYDCTPVTINPIIWTSRWLVLVVVSSLIDYRLAFALAVVLALAEYTDFVTEFEITSFLVHVVGSLYICVDILGVKGMTLCIWWATDVDIDFAVCEFDEWSCLGWFVRVRVCCGVCFRVEETSRGDTNAEDPWRECVLWRALEVVVPVHASVPLPILIPAFVVRVWFRA